jgi:hypothetical protein
LKFTGTPTEKYEYAKECFSGNIREWVVRPGSSRGGINCSVVDLSSFFGLAWYGGASPLQAIRPAKAINSKRKAKT